MTTIYIVFAELMFALISLNTSLALVINYFWEKQIKTLYLCVKQCLIIVSNGLGKKQL